MELLLFSIFSFQLLVSVILTRNLVHPIVMFKFYCTICAFILIPFSNIWGIELTLGTVLILTTALLWFDLGFLIILYITRIKKKTTVIVSYFNYSFSKAFLFFIINLLLLIIYIRHGSGYLQYGSIKELSESILSFKVAQREGEAEGIGIGYISTFVTVVGAVYIYVFLNEIFSKGFSLTKIIYLLPSIVTLLLNFFTGRRSFLLIIIIMVFILSHEWIVRKYKKLDLRKQFKFLLIGGLGFLVFYFFFTNLGDLFGKAGESTFANYLTGGIASFNQVYQNYSHTSEIFGQNTLRFFYVILNLIPGFEFPTDTINTTYHGARGLVTNIYTANLHYIADFGYAGIAINNLFIGAFYAFLYTMSKNEERVGFWNVLFSFFLINLFSYMGAEKFYTSMTLNIQQVILFTILLKTSILTKNSNRKY